jgi:hypothetical protein
MRLWRPDLVNQRELTFMQAHEQLPSGKTIMRQFDGDGRVMSETHTYGTLDIAIAFEFTDGVKTGEMYFVNKKLASRKRYEKARVEYADMPCPDTEVEDFGGELLKDVRAQRQQRARAAKEHIPDPGAAARIDEFCQSMLAAGKRADAESWIESKGHTLGEYSHAKSRNLVRKLLRIGARCVHVCDIDDYDDNQENSGHLVVELPDDSEKRRQVLREIDRIVAPQGYDGNFDDGQRYAYVKLD